MKRALIIATVLILAVGFGVWWFSPTQVVKRRTTELLDTMSFGEGTGKPARGLRVYAISRMLDEVVHLETPTISEANGTFERSELESGFSFLLNRAKRSEFSVEDFSSVTVDGDSATVVFTVEALVELPTYRPADGRYEVEFSWKRAEDGWRLSRAKWMEN